MSSATGRIPGGIRASHLAERDAKMPVLRTYEDASGIHAFLLTEGAFTNFDDANSTGTVTWVFRINDSAQNRYVSASGDNGFNRIDSGAFDLLSGRGCLERSQSSPPGSGLEPRPSHFLKVSENNNEGNFALRG
jgi:hypothetical protein